ncbi:MAG: HEAT repeat domain-containing protein [Candidatus Eremiobacteraeota bacterium]|nr:HEAT repeat domain-containing protein [Candidatus Eremiobacteraeota bacterium]
MIVVLAAVTVVAMLVAAVAAFALLRPGTVVPVATKPRAEHMRPTPNEAIVEQGRVVTEDDVVDEHVIEAVHTGEPSRNGVVADNEAEAGVGTSAPSADDAVALAAPRVMRWAKRFASRDGALDDETRLNLLRDLGIVRAPWGIPLLTEAYDEERSREHRLQALRSLAAYRHIDTQPTFEAVLRDGDEDERRIAASALAALRIRAALPA